MENVELFLELIKRISNKEIFLLDDDDFVWLVDKKTQAKMCLGRQIKSRWSVYLKYDETKNTEFQKKYEIKEI